MFREHVGWIKAEDALLAYDKNDNGQIDGIDEVFGNNLNYHYLEVG
ncbi:MAG: Unknown protein [uncultured Sulfurovum sp.]|uniref:Uncharacterized protein n=1 Tax=uncultured Sulfurovum sp. TaxID=269237 RepID=A0A6S6TJ66_9BACT|nr:MAG: Unknown protein [uncultured Sulfurovum sp.]